MEKVMSNRKFSKMNTISSDLITEVSNRLSNGSRVDYILPLGGRIHIERPLPFLCVYRFPSYHSDKGTERLIKAEASYLIVSGSKHFAPGISALIQNISKILSEKFNSFLIVEIWSALHIEKKTDIQESFIKPHFLISVSKARPPTTTVETLRRSLKRIKIHKQSADVDMVLDKILMPKGFSSLIPSKEAKKQRCFILGLEIKPIYRDPVTREVFPIVLRNLHRGLARSLRRAFFEFSATQTNYQPTHHKALGPRAIIKAVWEVDTQLAEISNSFDFILQATPVNAESAWADFKRCHFEKVPVLYYRPLPVDPALLKRRLYKIPLEKVEDPTLAYLFRQKQTELDRRLTMLGDRGTQRFFYGSLQLYGSISNELRHLAKTILKKIPPRSHENSRGGMIGAKDFAEKALKEIAYYRIRYPSLTARVEIRDDTLGLMVSHGNLLIGKEIKIPISHVEPLLHHEVGTHILTYFNGQAQPFKQLYSGLAGYEELQEGLAVLAEYLAGGLSRPRLRLLAGRVIASQCLFEGASFIDTFKALNHTYGFGQRIAFTITLRIYRSGGLTKDAVYLRGFVDLLKYLQKEGELESLYIGKVATVHVPIIEELQWRGVLRTPPLRPRYIDTPEAIERLHLLQKGLSVLDMITRRKK
jgi:uncharacterized protein (TIGR02421 family)